VARHGILRLVCHEHMSSVLPVSAEAPLTTQPSSAWCAAAAAGVHNNRNKWTPQVRGLLQGEQPTFVRTWKAPTRCSPRPLASGTMPIIVTWAWASSWHGELKSA
jgi:hypothetical protein